MKNCIALIAGFLLLLLPSWSIAQIPAKNPAIEIEQGSNLLFVVIIVICILITGLFLYLFSIDRKVKKLKNDI